MPSRRFVLAAFAVLGTLTGAARLAADDKKAPLKEGVRVAVVGDSITEQKLYSKYIADYFYACNPQLDAHVVQFGWGGETAGGFAGRLDNDLMPFKPDVVTLCYGMNDGGYQAFKPDIGQRYETPLAQIVGKLKKAGATIVVGSPGVVDAYTFRRDPEGKASQQAVTYNDNLAHLRDIAKKVAEANGMPFADVHDAMMKSMTAAQEKLGPKYHVAGGDGVHPAPDGQLLMAYAFLKAMQLDGDLGTITIDPKGESSAKNGHKVVKAEGGTVEIESTRYPFCFTGSESDPGGTRSILPFVPFNDDLNRLTLVVKNAPADKVKVTWGPASKVFDRADLEKGVNLAAAFANHPLTAAFQKVDAAVGDQQNFQTFMIKGMITNHRFPAAFMKDDKELLDLLAQERDLLWDREGKKHSAAKAVVVPVKHTITITAAAE
jgi:lysophospholipase L1-like esterase